MSKENFALNLHRIYTEILNVMQAEASLTTWVHQVHDVVKSNFYSV